MPIFKQVAIVVCASSLLVAGCTRKVETAEVDPQTCKPVVKEEPNRTAIGAISGAVIGAVGGAVIGGRKGALIGAGVGALAGGGVGLYMDKQEEDLRASLKNTDVKVTRDGDSLILNMPSTVTFDVNKADVKPDFYPIVEDIAEVLTKYQQTYVDVLGHTDSDGSAEHNMDLSIRRAESVAYLLVGGCVQKERVAAKGFGETQPIASNKTREGKAQNRRVEIKLIPLT